LKNLLKLFFAGLVISLIGSLPIGMLNIAAIHIGNFVGKNQAILFALGAIAVELIYVRITLYGIELLEKHKQSLNLLFKFNNLLILTFAFYNLYMFFYPTIKQKTYPFIYTNYYLYFFIGMLLNSINFLQVTFWSGFNILLYRKNILINKNIYIYVYLLSISIGTFICFILFIYGGGLIQNIMQENKSIYHLLVFALLLVLLVYQKVKIKKKSYVSVKI